MGMRSTLEILAATAMFAASTGASVGVGRRKRGKAPLTKAQKKVRAKNKAAGKQRAKNRK